MATREDIINVVATIDLTKRWEMLNKCVDDIDKILVNLGKEGVIFGLQGIPQACNQLDNARRFIITVVVDEQSIAGPYIANPLP